MILIPSMLKAASAYAMEGISVFPCEKKIPLTGTGGFKNASASADDIVHWWTDHPNAQIGVPTGATNHLFVIDVDGPKGIAAVKKMKLPPTRTIQTRPGRYQLWYRQPDDVASKCTAGILAAQLDTRGDGGYVIAPPSIHHQTGDPYRVVKDLPWSPAPLELLEPHPTATSTPPSTDLIVQGTRHKTMLSIAGALRARGLSREVVLAELHSANERLCDPPLDGGEIQKLADYVAAKPPGFRNQRNLETSAEVETEIYSSVARERGMWLWPGRIASGKLNLFVGDPGKGKSLVTIDIAARVSTGAAFPDGEVCEAGDVLIISAEDDPHDTVRPRLDRAGADVSRVHRIKAVKVTLQDGQQGESFFNLERDIAKLEDAVEKLPGLKLIVVDPVNAYMGRTDTFMDSAVRSVLGPFVEMASKRKITIIAIMHLRKAEATAILRVSGSVGFVAAARIVWGFGDDPNNPDRHIMVGIKNNLAKILPPLAYRISSDEPYEPPFIEWINDMEITNLHADDVLNNNPRQKHARARDHAEEWLRKLLQDGPVPQQRIEAEAERQEFSWRTIRRAKDDLGVRSRKASFGRGWLWELPNRGQDVQGAQ